VYYHFKKATDTLFIYHYVWYGKVEVPRGPNFSRRLYIC